jgi:hypothetical protein
MCLETHPNEVARIVDQSEEITELKRKNVKLKDYIRSTRETLLKEDDWRFEFSLVPYPKTGSGERVYHVQFSVTETQIDRAIDRKLFLEYLIKDKIFEKLKKFQETQ